MKEAMVKQYTSQLSSPIPIIADPPGVRLQPAGDADALYLAEHFREAAYLYSGQLETQPTNIKAHLRRGDCYQKMGQTQAAIQDYSEAIRLNPNETLALNNRALAYLSMGDTDKALSDYAQIRTIESHSVKASDSSTSSATGAVAGTGETFVGPRGGVYHYSKSGKKVYEHKHK